MIALLLVGAAFAGGSVLVTSDPPGGSVSIDGTATRQSTPTTIDDLPAGSHEIRVVTECAAGRVQVDIVEGQQAKIDVPLVTQGGMLTLDLSPMDAQVELDGSRMPVASNVPMAVDCGTHRVKVSADGHETAIVEVTVNASRTTTLPVTLEEIGTAQLQVDVAPPTATISLDDNALGTGPQQLDVTAGPHTLRAELDGYVAQERQLVVLAGTTLPIAFSLEPDPTVAAVDDSGRKRRPWIGIAVASVGVAGLAWGTSEYFAGQPGWTEFNDRRDKVESGLWPVTYQDDPSAWAYEVYDDEVKAHRSRMLIGDVVGGVLLASGLVLTFTL